MKAETVSTLAGREIMRSNMARNQTRLVDVLKEFSTSRHADVGRALGSGISSVLDMRQIAIKMDGLTATNGIVKQRLGDAQSALTAMRQLGSGFLETTLSVHQAGKNRDLLVADAKARMGTLVDTLSVTTNGMYVFSGVNVAAAPVDNYLGDPPGPARAAVIAAFTAEFGFPPSDPQAATITPTQMRDYLDGSFAGLFDDPAWGTTFSNASDDVMRDRISHHEEIDSSASANDTGIRKLFFALTLAIDGGVENLSADTFEVVARRIIDVSGESTLDIVSYQSKIGVAQERLTQANERIAIEKGTLDRRIGEAEGIDPYKAADELTLLMTRIEASYAVTARMQQLTLLNYI